MKPSLTPFVTIPRPVVAPMPSNSRSTEERVTKNVNDRLGVYLRPGEQRIIERAAKLCNVSKSEFVRQAAINVCTALGVDDGTGENV